MRCTKCRKVINNKDMKYNVRSVDIVTGFFEYIFCSAMCRAKWLRDKEVEDYNPNCDI